MSERITLTDTGAFHEPIDGVVTATNRGGGTVVVGVVKKCKHPAAYYVAALGHEFCPDCGWNEDITN